MRTSLTITVAGIVGLSVFGLASCAPAPKNQQPPLPSPIVTTKPNSISNTRVSLTALTEVSHLERALKPFLIAGRLGTSGAISSPPETEAPRELELSTGEDLSKCRSTRTTSSAMWETRWSCGLSSTTPGKKEIEGVERTNYDPSTRTLTYVAKFSIRNYEDREARANAHTLVTTRKISVVFASRSPSMTSAQVRMTSTANVQPGAIAYNGSNWHSSFNGTLQRSTTGIWSFAPNARISFNGLLFGLDGERGTNWAAGEYRYVSNSSIEMQGLSDPSTCTKPIGRWKVSASGGGQNFDTETESSAGGVADSAGTMLPWPANLCDQP